MNTRTSLLATALAVAALAPGLASAAIISVNFRESDAHTNQLLASSTVAGGGAGVAVSNWNTLAGPDGTAPSLVDDNGVTLSTTAITWTSGGTWGDGTADTDATAGVGNAQLLRGYLDDHTAGTPESVTITVTNVPYALYNVVVYFSTDTAGNNYGGFSANGTSTGPLAGPKQLWGTNPNLDSTNSAIVSGVSGSTLEILGAARDGDIRGSISGFQIIQVPEPSTVALSGLAALALVARRRRN